jgi:hypothetical protein
MKSGDQGMKDYRTDMVHLNSTIDFGKEWKIIQKGVIGFATFEEYMVAAVLQDSELKLFVSRDGDLFNQAEFPESFKIPELGYTVLESTTGFIYLDVYMDRVHNYGTLFLSNSDGLKYTQSLAATNRDTRGFVDFEKVQGIKGVALINEIVNLDAVKTGHGISKEIQTKLTIDDGATWKLLKSPTEGKSLHLHAFTQRRDHRDQYSSPTAIGLFVVSNKRNDDGCWKYGRSPLGL